MTGEPRWTDLDVLGAHVETADVVRRGLCAACVAGVRRREDDR